MTDTVKSDTPRTDTVWVDPKFYPDDERYKVSCQLEQELNAFQQAMPEEPKLFFFSGKLLRYTNGVLQETIEHSPYLSTSSPPVILYDDYDALRSAYAALKVERDLARQNNVLFQQQNLDLAAKLAACEQDAKRYRWLRLQIRASVHSFLFPDYMNVLNGTLCEAAIKKEPIAPHLDKAIDALLKERQT